MHQAAQQTDVSVLGRIEIRVGGRLVDLGTPRMRAIMAALALSEGRPVTFDTLVERVWGATPPATAVGTLQRYVASLRRALEPDRDPDRAPSSLVTMGSTYTLAVPGAAGDAHRLRDGVVVARQALECIPDRLRPVAAAAHVDTVTDAVARLDEVLALWRGEPYADLAEHDGQVTAERARLHDLRASAVELRLTALLALGRHSETLGDLETMTSMHPLHERWWALRAVALVRSGRQAEALEALGEVRSMLADELGVDPSPPLQELYGDILRQSPGLAWSTTDVCGPAAAAPRLGVRTARPAPPRPRWPLVGRDPERAVLSHLVVDAQEGHFRSGLVTGEAGIGKTRLVQELALEAHGAGMTVATGRCSEHAPALWPLRAVVEGLGTPDAGDDLDVLHTRPHDFTTWQKVVAALRHATAGGPVLVVVEDVHWADTVTLQVLEHLVADHDLTGLSLVLTRRTHEGEATRMSRLAAAVARSAGLRVDLPPLSAAASRQLALTITPDLDDVDAVCRRGGGNPFFVAELARSGGCVGGGLADVVRTRLTPLDPQTRTALGLASVVGPGFDVDLLAELLGSDPADTESLLEPALRAGLVRRTTHGAVDYRFAHDVVRDVIRDELPVSTATRCRRLAEQATRAREARVHERVAAWQPARTPAVRRGAGDPRLATNLVSAS